MAGYHTVELTDLDWQRQAPDLDPASFLVTADGSNRLDPHGQTVVFVKEGFWAQQDLVGLMREEPRWTSTLLRRWQQLHFTNLKRFSRFGAPTTERLGLVEVCKIVGATYHKRLLPTPAPASQRERPGTADTPADSAPTTQNLDTPAATPQQRTNQAPGGLDGRQHDEAQRDTCASPEAPPADAPSPPAEATPEDPPAEAPEPPPLHTDSDAEEGINVDVNVKAPRGMFFVRLTLQRAGINSYAQLPVTTTVDYFTDSGCGDWLIPKSRYDESLRLNWRRGKRFKMWWEAPDTPGIGTWWTGTVLGRVQRDRFDPRRTSPWEALRVKWDSGDQETCVSMWEIEKDEGQWLTLPDEVETLDEGFWEADWHSDQEVEDAGESSEASEPGRRPRRQRRKRRVVLPGEIEREQHLRDPKRRRQGSRLQSSSAGADFDTPMSAEAWSAPEEPDPPAEGPAEEVTARPVAASATVARDEPAPRQPAGLTGAPLLPRRPQQRGPSLPLHQKSAAKQPYTPGQESVAAVGEQQLPRVAKSAPAKPSIPSSSQQPPPAEPAAVQSIVSSQPSTAGAPATPAAAPAAALLQPQLGPEQLAALHAIAQNPALQAVAAQPDRDLSEQLLVTLLSQAFGQAQPQGQPAPQAQPAAQPQPAQSQPGWHPAAQGSPAWQTQPHEQVIAQFWPNSQPRPQGQAPAQGQPLGQPVLPRKPFRIHPPPIRTKKSAPEQLRGRRPAAQTAPAAVAQLDGDSAALQPGCLPTHRTLKSPGKKSMDWNSLFCSRCGEDEDVIGCDGTCLRSFHKRCLTEQELPDPNASADSKWYCPQCEVGKGVCSICREVGLVQQDIYKCKMGSCGHYMHHRCLKAIEAAGQYLKIFKEVPNADRTGVGELVYTCPSHFCQVCHISGDAMKMMRCWRCPQAYHSRCLPKAARRLNSKNIECEACGLVRAGREQAMAAMSLSADPAGGAMLHGQCTPEAQQASLGNAPQMPPAAAHQVSPAMSAVSPPAVAFSLSSPPGWTPPVACTPERPTAELQNQSAVQSHERAPSVGTSLQQPQQAMPHAGSLPNNQTAIKSYSPADTVERKIPAVTACNISPDVQLQAMQGAWNSHMAMAEADKQGADKPKQQQKAPETEDEEEASQDSQQEPEFSSGETSVSEMDFNTESEDDYKPARKKNRSLTHQNSTPAPAKRTLRSACTK